MVAECCGALQEPSQIAWLVAASPKGRAWDSKECIQPSQGHRKYFQEENTNIPRKTIQALSFPTSLLDALGKKILILLLVSRE